MPTKHFPTSEIACKCKHADCPAKGDDCMDQEFLEQVQLLREDFGKPLIPSSGARCPKRNAETPNAAKNSNHLSDPPNGRKAEAIDVEVTTETDRYRLVALAIKRGFTGIRIAKTFVHLDRRPGPAKMGLY